MPSLPTPDETRDAGRSALLVTDVVDSTALTEQLGDERMTEIWLAHDRIVRDLLVQHRGREADRTDGFLVLFDTVSDAVHFAVAFHRAMELLSEKFQVPFRARVGIHWALAIVIRTSAEDRARGAKPLEVEGLAKPTAARVMSLALGGQTLLTPEAYQALGSCVFRTESRGHWRVKGVSEPVELFEVGDGDAPFLPPPDSAKVYRVVPSGSLWLPARQVKHALPAERDAFVGRQADLHHLARTLDAGARLVSVLGPGGTGKTRLATRFAWTYLGDYPGGAWFCDLSEARDRDGIALAVASALGVPLGSEDPTIQLGHAIAGRGKCIVILDNFEQVARLAPGTLGFWLDRAPEASFVVTSREVLGLPGETALALAPLVARDSVALFVTRAVQADRDFTLAADDVPRVQALVALLDGLPLAIELAAARVRVMPPSVLLQRMSERFKLLTSSGGRHTRQATLRSALDWSWDLLSADEQTALVQLSVFQGGFTLGAAERVVLLTASWPTDAVQGLVDKSLVRRLSGERFDLLVCVQEYAGERLVGERVASETRHGQYFASLGGAESAVVSFQDLDNLVAACRRATRRDDLDVAVATLRAAWVVLEVRGPYAIAVELATELLGLPTLAIRDRGPLEGVLGMALLWSGRGVEAKPHLEAALTAQREAADRWAEGVALANLGILHLEQGRPETARAHIDAALAVHREVGNRRGEGIVLGNLGILVAARGALAEAQAHIEAAIRIHREVGNRRSEGVALGNLGGIHRRQGRTEEARSQFEAALQVHREVGDRRSEGRALGNLGLLDAEVGRMADALARYDAALAVDREVGNRRTEGVVLGRLGSLHLLCGRLADARACFLSGEVLLREALDPAELALLLCGRARLESRLGRPEAFRAILAEAEALASRADLGADSALGRALASARLSSEDAGP